MTQKSMKYFDRRPPAGQPLAGQPLAGQESQPQSQPQSQPPAGQSPGRRPLDRQTILIGLDGATFTVLDHLMAEGVMPFLKGLLASGCRGELTSVVPPLTPPAWISLVTGCRPGAHGVFNFLQFESPKSRYIKWLGFRDIRRETIWSIVNRHGMRAGGLNFIGMNPPPAVDGYMVPGFVSWRWLKKNSHPADLFDRFKEIPGFDVREMALNFREEEKAVKGCQREEYEDWISLHIRRERQWFEVVRYLMKNDPCHLTAMIFDGLDRIQHVCWRFLDPACYTLKELLPWEERVRQLCLEYFRNLDGFIEEIVHLGGPEANIFIASDHGFGPTKEIVYINQWLYEHGYLKWKDRVENPGTGSRVENPGPGSKNKVAAGIVEAGIVEAGIVEAASGSVPLAIGRHAVGIGRLNKVAAGKVAAGKVEAASSRLKESGGTGGQVDLPASPPPPVPASPPGEELESLGVESPYRSLLHLDWKQTRAYAATASSNGIIIQVAGKRGEEGIAPESYHSFREELIRQLLSDCRDPATGQPLITRIYTREEAFGGEHMDCAPDLTLVLRDSGFISIYPSANCCRQRTQIMGTHRPEGVFAAIGPGIRTGRLLSPLSIIQVAPTMLHSLGIPIPADMGGEVVTEIFDPLFLRAHPVEVGDPTMLPERYQDDASQVTEDAEGQEQIMLRLKSLGYV